jgi:intracellular septation protein
MTGRPINPVLKQVLELGPTVLFFVLYMWVRDEEFVINGTTYSGFIAVVVVFIPVILASIGALWWLSGTISRLQVFTVIMVVFFGGLTAWINDERFFKMKTTIVYGFFATVLAIGLLRGVSYMEWIMGQALPMQREGWMILTRRLTAMFALLAVLNEIVWRNFSTEVWVTVETFGFPIAMTLFLFAQIWALEKYLIEDQLPKK